MRGNADRGLIYRTIGYEHLLRWDPAWTRVVPNVAQSYSVNDDATEFTFKLRQDMRWPDGYLDKVVYSTFTSQQEIIEFTKSGIIGMQSRRISHPKFN